MRIMELLSGLTEALGPGQDWDPHTMGAPGSVPPFMPPGAPAPMKPATPTPPPMKTAGLGDTISNFFTTPQPIGGQSTPTEPSAVQQAVGNSSLNPFAPINQALQGANQAANPNPPTK